MPSIRQTRFALLAATFTLSSLAQAQTRAPDKTAESASMPQPAKALSPAESRQSEIRRRDTSLDPLRTYHLRGGSANDGNELLTGLRQMLDPLCKLYLVPSQNAILLRCNQEQLVLADEVLHEINTPRQNYRLTYSVVESEGGRRIGVQHFAMTMIENVRTTLKDGSRVPVATGSYNTTGATAQTQFTYLDVGLNFDATLSPGVGGLRLNSKVEQSASGEEKTIAGVTEPIIRQAVLEGSATLQVGKPVMLGSLDVAASARHLDIEVLLEAIK